MSRVIKFRAWTLGTPRQMRYFDLQDLHGGELDDNTHIIDSQVPVMQFTGLTDRNGKEIYEGDVVRHHYYGESGVLEWSQGKNQWVLKFMKDGVEQPDMFPIDKNSYEILGNIYEHPHLIDRRPQGREGTET